MKRVIESLRDLTAEEQGKIIDDIQEVPAINLYIPSWGRQVVFSLRELQAFLLLRVEFDWEKFQKRAKKSLDKRGALELCHMIKDLLIRRETEKKMIKRLAWESLVIDKEHLDMELDEFRMQCKTEYEDSKKIEEETKKETAKTKKNRRKIK